jgi:hypothetical protein
LSEPIGVGREGHRIAKIWNYPWKVASDKGTELSSCALLKAEKDRKTEWHADAPDKLIPNRLVKRFNGRICALGKFAVQIA